MATVTHAHPDLVEEVVVSGQRINLMGESLSASEGVIGQVEINSRPLLRSGEILEFVPGMVVTQHSGSGKANQYFLRGFNLDHGTDFSTTVEGVPVNMRTHGHGQGYTDLNFVVPEFVQRIEYQKGPYHAENGDFSAAGSAEFYLIDPAVEQPFASLEAGGNRFFRSVAAGSVALSEGNLLLGLESQRYDGPWQDIDEDVHKLNGLVRYSVNVGDGRLTLTSMLYSNEWLSADQIPQRAVTQGLISRLGSLDDTVGGAAKRNSVSSQWNRDDLRVSLYLVQSELNLFSNFTYFLQDPINGDQFEQVDERRMYGGEVINGWKIGLSGNRHSAHRAGLQVRVDDIEEVALYQTRSRQRLDTTRLDEVLERSVGLFWDGEIHLGESLSARSGLRYDWRMADVESSNSLNSGRASDGLISLKGGITYRVRPHWETYLSAGQSFHSNDARGATIQIDPLSDEPAEPVDLLVRGEGAELGLRYSNAERVSLSAALWLLELDSELIFVGDAGNTEASRASRRSGLELAAYYWLNPNLTVDLEAAWTRALFTEGEQAEGNRIDGSLPVVVSSGFTWSMSDRWRSTLRVRHFGKRVLDSMGETQSGSFTVVNLGVDYELASWQFGADVLNLFNSQDHDIDYLYSSRLEGEASEGIEDIHFHPIEPRTVRWRARYDF